MQEAALSFLPFSHSVSMHHYNHWSSDGDFSSKKELASLKKNYGNEKNVVLVAHAEGVPLGLAAIESGYIKPFACVFIDIPKASKSSISSLKFPILETSLKGGNSWVEESKLFLSQYATARLLE
jgi:hypothetical protein